MQVLKKEGEHLYEIFKFTLRIVKFVEKREGSAPPPPLLRDWPLITGRGEGYKMGGGGHVEVYPYEKWGGGVSHAGGGHTTFGVVSTLVA